ncbi:SnoaL-domain-containing protein [Daldinia vernicosa]|uniref:SnoaL-domain-containing protein n=1 Tax=Daldinia vernicosa TaxID=114800 RepID=UPI002008D998|nr:SnoaL-domain-containing protein [Daldinia vernicosa]KAI0846335.1 SnoaL-domain-containing protein [Daldinia vernicosa]
MADIEIAYRSIVRCINERRWEELPRYMHSHFVKDGQDFTAEDYIAEMRKTGDVELTIDAVTVDKSQQCMGAAVFVRFKPASVDAGDAAIPGKTISFAEQSINWFTDGKLSKTFTVADYLEMQRQLSNPDARYTPDPITEEENPPRGSLDGGLSALELESTYRAYCDCVNEKRMETDLHKFLHPQTVFNAETLTEEGYRHMVQSLFEAIPDLDLSISTIVVDERAQRVAARIAINGTPTDTLAGVKPNGGAVSTHEHVTYRFEKGRIARVWSIVDWASYTEQQMSN